MNKIFAALSPFVVSNVNDDSERDHLGVKIACLELQESIIRHGGCDRYDFLLGRGSLSDEAVAAYISAQGWDPEKILIFDGALPLDRIKSTPYHVIHRMDPFLDEILALRHALGHPLAPATVTTHTTSYAFLMTLWMQCLLGHALPCDAIVCTSKAVQGMLQSTFDLLSDRFSTRFGARIPAFRGSLPIIPLGVNVEYWKPENDKRAAKTLLDLPDQSCVILCPARFSAHDKMDLRPFLMALRRLLAVVGPDFFRVVLVGDDLRTNGAESKLIRELADRWGLTSVVRIDTNGMPSRMRQYYAAADIVVSLIDNLQETFGLTVVQAMACGLPVVVSDWDGYKDTVVEGKTGFRIKTYWAECDRQISSLHRHWMVEHLLLAQSVAVDTEQMYRDLYALVIDPGLRRRFGQAGRKRAEDLYAWPVVMKRYQELWDDCHEKFRHVDPQEWAQEEHESVLSPAYFRQFAHYASEIITTETQLAPAVRGAELAQSPNVAQEVLLPADMKPVFHPAVFKSIVSHVSDWPVSFGALVTEVSQEVGQPPDLTARHVMWLMKYGVVTRVKPLRHLASPSVSAAATSV